MEKLADYVRNIFCLYIVLTIVDNLITNEKYGRYIRLFCGIIMIIVVLRPAAALFGVENIKGGEGFFDEFSVSEDIRLSIMQAEKGQKEEIIQACYTAVNDKVREYAGEWGYELLDTQTEINLDEQSEDYGRIVLIRAQLAKRTGTDGFGAANGQPGNDSFEGYDIISIKNNLANFYNIPLSNIYISVHSEQPAGL